MTVKTGKEISIKCSPWLRMTKKDTDDRNKALDEKYYPFLDVDARIKFYQQYCNSALPIWLSRVWMKTGIGEHYDRWFFNFCFDNMKEDFQKKIKRLSK